MFDAISLYQWWRTTISDIEDIPKPEKRWLSATRRASDRTDMPSMAISPAFRVTLTIRQLAERDIRYFANHAGKPPVAALIGAVHGQ